MNNKKLVARKSLKLSPERKLTLMQKHLLILATKKVVKRYKKTLQKLGSN